MCFCQAWVDYNLPAQRHWHYFSSWMNPLSASTGQRRKISSLLCPSDTTLPEKLEHCSCPLSEDERIQSADSWWRHWRENSEGLPTPMAQGLDLKQTKKIASPFSPVGTTLVGEGSFPLVLVYNRVDTDKPLRSVIDTTLFRVLWLEKGDFYWIVFVRACLWFQFGGFWCVREAQRKPSEHVFMSFLKSWAP